MSLSSILGALDAQVTPSTEPLLPNNNVIYLICGRKGSGKSTLCRLLNEIMDDVEVIYDPVEKWRSMKDDVTGENILEVFYKNQEHLISISLKCS